MSNKTSSSDKKQIFDVLYDLLSVFHKVCVDNDLSYSLYGGTLIGAIRHNGFIPWDDDIDVIMMRDQYEKFKEVASKGAFPEPYFLQSPETEEGSPRLFLRLRNSDTTSISNTDSLFNINQGMFIDIFPADYFPDAKSKRKLLPKKVAMYNRLSGGYARYYSGIGCKGDSLPKKIMYWALLPFYKTGVITSRKMFKAFEKTISSSPYEECSNIADSLWLAYDPDYYFPKELFEAGYCMHAFEQGAFMIFKDYDKILTHMYGDYMTPKQEPTSHGELLQLVDVPYKIYCKEHRKELEDNWKA